MIMILSFVMYKNTSVTSVWCMDNDNIGLYTYIYKFDSDK